MINELQEKLEALQNEKNVVERKMALRRERHSEDMESANKYYQDKKVINTGAPVVTDEFKQEIEDKFEESLSQEFAQELAELDEKIENAKNELKEGLKTEIADKDNKLQDKSHQIEDKNSEINKINDEILKESRSPEADMNYVESLRNNIVILREELNSMLGEQGTLQKEKEELEAILEELEPQSKDVEKNEADEHNIENSQEEKPEEEKTEEEKQEEEKPEEEKAEQQKPEGEKLGKPVQPSQQTNARVDLLRRLKSKGTIKKMRIRVSKDGIRLDLKNTWDQIYKDDYTEFPDSAINTTGVDLKTVSKACQVGDKYVVRKILQFEQQVKLSTEQAKEYLEKYIELYENPENQQNFDNFEISYNVKGLRMAGLGKEKRKEIENNARKAKKLGIASVKAGFLTKAKWFAQDAVTSAKQKLIEMGKDFKDRLTLPEAEYAAKREQQEMEEQQAEQQSKKQSATEKFRQDYSVDTSKSTEQAEVAEKAEESKEPKAAEQQSEDSKESKPTEQQSEGTEPGDE